MPAQRTSLAPVPPTPPPLPSLLDAADALVGALVGVRLAAHAARVELPRGAVAELGTWALLQRARAACLTCAAALSGALVRPCPVHDRPRAREGRRRR
jgi:hypothetical protein